MVASLLKCDVHSAATQKKAKVLPTVACEVGRHCKERGAGGDFGWNIIERPRCAVSLCKQFP